ncbi:MAG TPA: hypothetical protein VFN26_03150 [Candidatus Acidoferrum sp.]|nr:hypothetical protein [Candidatus Acidoferrum sp.]
MNTDDLRWLLQTIEEPEIAQRFVLAQYTRGRIPDRVMADVCRERHWIRQTAIQVPAAATGRSTEYAIGQIPVVPQEEQFHEHAILTAF